MYIAINAEFKDFHLSSSNAIRQINHSKIKFEENKAIVENELNKFILANGNFDGTKMQEEWFPEIEADVFLSHSHADIDLTLFLASIFEGLGLKVFIDSTVWGHANGLLKQIDDILCPNGNGSYNYDLRNYSTSHVHMMLSVALNKMIDKCECLFFINTPKSVTTKSIVANKTESPWIYSEIATTKTIRRKKSSKRELRKFSKGGTVELIAEGIEHTLDLSDLIAFTNNDMMNWLEQIEDDKHVLDSLYEYINNRDNINL